MAKTRKNEILSELTAMTSDRKKEGLPILYDDILDGDAVMSFGLFEKMAQVYLGENYIGILSNNNEKTQNEFFERYIKRRAEVKEVGYDVEDADNVVRLFLGLQKRSDLIKRLEELD